LRLLLEQEDGFEVLKARDGLEGLSAAQHQCPDAILLDVRLPRMDGWEVCRQIREFSDVPVIMLSASQREEDIVRGLDLGADDYVPKPFRTAELKARIRASLRRGDSPVSQNSKVRIDDRVVVDRAGCRLLVERRPVKLSSVECKLVNIFLDNPDRILSHQSLLAQAWGWEYMDATHYLKVYVRRLREKLEENAAQPRHLLTERGLGYRFQLS